MKHLLTLLAVAGMIAPTASNANPLVVHEWGTFTSVSGSDGALLSGLEREEQAVPPFVHSHAGFSPANKGWDRPVANVTIKMETPVLYFYSDVAQPVTVNVAFHGGSISQWYPERSGGENLAGLSQVLGMSPLGEVLRGVIPAVDFAKGYEGSASWRVDVLAPGATDEISTQKLWEQPGLAKGFPGIAQWPRARVASANKLRGPGPKPEVEGFIFYRGIGNFPLPLRIKSADGRLLLANTGAQPIPFLFVYEKRATSPQSVVWWSGALSAGASEQVPLSPGGGKTAAESMLSATFPAALEQAGLTAEEARALIATWRESYFEQEGLRVFWIVPRALTDSLLPITLDPKPEKLERVLVGRSEVLTPAFEAEIARGFAADRGQRWRSDRYYEAYLARAKQLGVVLPARRP